MVTSIPARQAEGRGRSSGHRRLPSAGGLARLLAVAAIVVALAFGARAFVGQAPAALAALARADLRWVGAAIAAEAASYALIAAVFQRTARSGSGIGWWLSLRTAFLAFGLGNILPGSPAPGITLATLDLRRQGVPPRRTGIALGWTTWFLARAFLGLGATAAIIAVAEGHIPERHSEVVLAFASFLLATVILTAFIAAHSRPLEWTALALARLRWPGSAVPTDPRTAGQQWHAEAVAALGSRKNGELAAMAAVGAWMADALCLQFALAALGVPLPFDLLLLGYCAAIAASCIPFLPGGAGAVEAVLPALLHGWGLPIETALGGTLAWRALSLLLPAAVGAAFVAGSRVAGALSAGRSELHSPKAAE